MIEYAEISQDEKELITVSGRFAVSICPAHRGDTGDLNGTADCAGQLIGNHIINPGNTDRSDGLHRL